MPAGMALAVPTRVGPMLSTPLLSLSGKLRILGDLFVPKPTRDPDDETVASFLTRHFGREATEHLAGPLLGGIFAGDIEELSILSTFPQLVELEKKSGSLVRALFATERARVAQSNKGQNQSLGAALDDPLYPPVLIEFVKWLYRQGKRPESPFQSLRGGMGQLIDKLVAKLPPGSLQLGVSVARLQPLENHRWRAHFSKGDAREFDAVLLCLPAHSAASVIPDPALESELSAVPYVSTATVFFALSTSQLPRPLDASGYIVPRNEGRALASTWVSTKWEGRSPANGSLIRVFLGGAREPELVTRSSDADLAQLARDELEGMIGPIHEPENVWTFKHIRTNPQPVVGHNSRLARIESRLAEMPGLLFSSSAFGGVGIPDCIRRAEDAARVIARLLG
jgi:protoporphyrinogen/coproporphyrinogen III oxidase